MITTIAFDADDTLWHNERIFVAAKERFKSILASYDLPGLIEQRLDETESRNIEHFGYGIKGFTLSMIETAIELTDGRVTGEEISWIVANAREMMASPIDVLPGVRETVAELSGRFRLMVITKGDLFDQETKIARSGLGDFFDAVEIVSEKLPDVYAHILARHSVSPQEFLMVGNSLRSDILPVIEIGAQAVHVPYETEWFRDRVLPEELNGKHFTTLERISDLSVWLGT
jgi:putative hydrolase of the HAD superfamily